MKTSLIFILVSISVQVIAMEPTPYAGQQTRTIKALSSSEIDSLKSGKGMGLAKAAELNHFPGPRHVLDEADKLSLSKDQLNQTNALFDRMKKEAISVGNKIISAEELLDDMFASGKLSANELESQLNEIGKYRAQLRYVHLKTHLEQKKILSSRQIEHYDMLRGYMEGASKHQHNGHH